MIEQVLISGDFDHTEDAQLTASLCLAFRLLAQGVPAQVNAAPCVGGLLEVLVRHVGDPHIALHAVSMISLFAFEPTRDAAVRSNIDGLLQTAQYSGALRRVLELHCAGNEKVTLAAISSLGMYLHSGLCKVETLHSSGLLGQLHAVYRDHMDRPLVLELATDVVCLVCGMGDSRLAQEVAVSFRASGVLDHLRTAEARYFGEQGMEEFVEGVSQATYALDSLLLSADSASERGRPGRSKRLDAAEAEIV